MSKEPPEPHRKVTPFKPGKRPSTFRRLNLDFAGTALDQYLIQEQLELARQPEEVENPAAEFPEPPVEPGSGPLPSQVDTPLKRVPRPQSGGYTNPVVATNVATSSPVVATNVATPQSGGYKQHSTGGYKQPRSKDRHKYEGKEQFNIRLDSAKSQKIKELCITLHMTQQEFWDVVATHIIELAATNVATLGQTFKGLVATNVAHDDMMIFNTHDDIIMRYQRYAGQAWTRRDDREGVKYNGTDLRIIEIAFISTIEKKLRGNTAKQPIRSFNYFTQEIDLLLEQQQNKELPATLDEYHKYVVATWEKRIKPMRDAKWGKNPETKPGK
ncbi:MAG: hypothetical protein K1Y36_08495 [Blastocatellia bacterium]|nr:hypothetical protein [Blastocatellia bacterium]